MKTCSRKWIVVLLLCETVICEITGPTTLSYIVGDDAHFRWQTDNNAAIVITTWGIKNNNIADPQFIYVDMTSRNVNVNSNLEPSLRKRLSFDGDLKKGLAWFTLKSVTLNDTNQYLASISANVTRVMHCTVALTVKERSAFDITTRGPEVKQLVNATTKGSRLIWPTEDPEDTVRSNTNKLVLPLTVATGTWLLSLAMAIDNTWV